MSKKLFLQELYSDNWAINQSGIDTLRAIDTHDVMLMNNDVEPISVTGVHESGIIKANYTAGEDVDVFNAFPEGSIAILPLAGIMTKYNTWWNWGVDTIAELIRAASISPKINGVIIMIDTPGGSVNSVFQIVDAITKSTKPVFALIDGGCYSAGEYVRGFCNKSYALHEMCGFGSVGIMATFRDYSKLDEKYGITTTVIYPPESKFKNLPEREALDGKPDLIIKEQLSPWAIHFQNTMKKNLPNMDTSIEGILEGKEFYATAAVKNGWIDGIKNLSEVISEMIGEIETRKTIQ
jgi:protease IV